MLYQGKYFVAVVEDIVNIGKLMQDGDPGEGGHPAIDILFRCGQDKLIAYETTKERDAEYKNLVQLMQVVADVKTLH